MRVSALIEHIVCFRIKPGVIGYCKKVLSGIYIRTFLKPVLLCQAYERITDLNIFNPEIRSIFYKNAGDLTAAVIVKVERGIVLLVPSPCHASSVAMEWLKGRVS